MEKRDAVRWKEEAVTKRNKMEEAAKRCDPVAQIVFTQEYLLATARVWLIESNIKVGVAALLLVLILLVGGCSAGVGVGADYDIFYPKKQWVNADGTSGKFDDPAESRRQVTRHGVSMQRNNELQRIGGSN